MTPHPIYKDATAADRLRILAATTCRESAEELVEIAAIVQRNEDRLDEYAEEGWLQSRLIEEALRAKYLIPSRPALRVIVGGRA